ncbi:hypothetical protein HQO82_22660 [Rhodococcus fascians]|nr:hypothetical protein [Rhodococcus fascians]MBY4116638.1 hypothetical protein [Rhodococcus fascians]
MTILRFINNRLDEAELNLRERTGGDGFPEHSDFGTFRRMARDIEARTGDDLIGDDTHDAILKLIAGHWSEHDDFERAWFIDK